MLDENRIVFVCCADDSVRDNYIAGHYADEIVVPFTADDFHLCSNVLVMNTECKKMLKDVLRTASSVVVSTPVIDLNVLDGLFIKRVLKGGYSYEAVVLFSDISADAKECYRPPRPKHGYSGIRYVCMGHAGEYNVADCDKYERSVMLLAKYNDEPMLHIANECMFVVPCTESAACASYEIVPYLENRGICVRDIVFVQNVIYALRSFKGRESESSLAKVREAIGVRAYNAFALLKIVHSRV